MASTRNCQKLQNLLIKREGKAIPLQFWTGPEGYKSSESQISRQSAHEIGKDVSPTHRPPLLLHEIFLVLISVWTAVAQWLRCCATDRKVAGSISDGT